MKLLTKYLLSKFGGSAVTRKELERACKRFGELNINYLLHYGYLVRVLRKLYYVKTLEEFKLKKALNTYRIISLGMNKLKVNWYFGLYTALRLNGLTHEFFGEIFVLSNKIYRPKAIKILEERVRFIKLKNNLFGFGIIKRDEIRFSDPEKTILDLVYVFRYRGVPEERIISVIEYYGKNLKKDRLKKYLKFYPKSVGRVLENDRFI